MTTLIRPGVPVGGFKTAGQFHVTNKLEKIRGRVAVFRNSRTVSRLCCGDEDGHGSW